MDQEKLTSTVNRSGFPLQIALQHAVSNATFSSPFGEKWVVSFSEHSWRNPADESSGFIDLIIENSTRTVALVVECKRVVETSWLFLVDNQSNARRHAKAWVTKTAESKAATFDFADLTLDPATPESQFCIVDGQDAKSQPMLERVSANVISSIEALAFQELQSCMKRGPRLRMYFGVIATTAKLLLCRYDPKSISIADGKLNNAVFEEVPFLRFRKQMSVDEKRTADLSIFEDYRAYSRAKENTVFVVNSDSFVEFLQQFEVDNSSAYGIP